MPTTGYIQSSLTGNGKKNSVAGGRDGFLNTGCVIMASGQSVRFGQNKLMAEFNNRPLIGHILSTTQSLFAKSVVVTRHKSVQDYCNSIGQKAIMHNLPHRNDTVRLGTEYMMQNSVDNIIFFQGDQPFVSPDSIAEIVICAENNSGKIVRLSWKGRDCAPILFPSCYFEGLTKLPKKRGGNFLAVTNPDAVIRVKAKDEIETIDIDTPDQMILQDPF